MISRRAAIVSIIAAAASVISTAAGSQEWKQKYPELVSAIVPAENATGTVERWTPFAQYLEKAIGAKVTLRVANDYTAVIEGQKNRQIHIGFTDPAPMPVPMRSRMATRSRSPPPKTRTARSDTTR